VATDMLDVTTFQALTKSRTAGTPLAVYFHENQLSYPWSPDDRDVRHNRDKHYGFINYTTALTADAVFFNSKYHLDSFLSELERLLNFFPDHNESASVEDVRNKSSVLRLGIDLERFDEAAAGGTATQRGEDPLILWNHRWEYDKNPDAFFKALTALAERGIAFELALLGENFSQVPEPFLRAREVLADRVVQFGYVDGFGDYASWLFRSDILPVTSIQDFFGAGVAEAVYCGCRPLLPARLAYPELIPESLHADVFYTDDGQYEDRLEQMLLAGRTPADPGLKAAMAQFDWRRMAPVYDTVFEAVLAGGPEGGTG
jgi:glycosyltransferase involved in cell wall biosynthesis